MYGMAVPYRICNDHAKKDEKTAIIGGEVSSSTMLIAFAVLFILSPLICIMCLIMHELPYFSEIGIKTVPSNI